MATDQPHDSVTPPDAVLRQSRSGRRSSSRATWVALLLSLAAILAAIGWPTFRRSQVIKSLEENGVRVLFTDDREWVTDWLGENGNGLRTVQAIIALADTPPDSLHEVGVLDEATTLSIVHPTGITRHEIDAVRSLDRLTNLQLAGSAFSDQVIADTLSGSPPLELLSIWRSDASKSAMEAISKIPSLEEIHLSARHLEDADFVGLTPVSNLQELTIFEGRIGDAAMAWVAQSIDLRVLEIYQSQVTDEGLAELAQLTNLSKLRLCHSPHVTDAGIAHLEVLPNLRELFVDAHCATPAFIESLRRMPSLMSVSVGGTIADPALREILDREWHVENEEPFFLP